MERAYAQCTDHCFSAAYKCILSTLSPYYIIHPKCQYALSYT